MVAKSAVSTIACYIVTVGLVSKVKSDSKSQPEIFLGYVYDFIGYNNSNKVWS